MSSSDFESAAEAIHSAREAARGPAAAFTGSAAPSTAPGPPEWTIESEWDHPQGGHIVVYTDGSMEAFGANGKKKKTSATPEKLRAGHGQWARSS